MTTPPGRAKQLMNTPRPPKYAAVYKMPDTGDAHAQEHIDQQAEDPKSNDPTRLCMRCCRILKSVKCLPIFDPDDYFLISWKIILIILLIYTILEIPYSMAFAIRPTANNPWTLATLMVDSLLIVDIVINFRTAYIDRIDRLRVVRDKRAIACRYLRGFFWIDFMSTVPSFVDVLTTSGLQESMTRVDVFQILRMLRFLKLLRVIKLLRMVSVFYTGQQWYGFQITRWTASFFKLFCIICAMLLVAHYFSCIWYSIGRYGFDNDLNSWIDIIVEAGDDDKGTFVQYSYAFYWAVVTLFTTGYGDITANNIYEQWAASMGVMVGSCIFAYFIGVLTTQLTQDMLTRHNQEQIEKTIAFCSHFKLPPHLRRMVMTHMHYWENSNFPFDSEYIMDSLPTYVQTDIELFLRDRRLKGLHIMRDLPDKVVGQIALRLQAKSCGVDRPLFRKNDIGDEIFIQRTGRSYLKTGDADEACNPETVLREYVRGDVIGITAILSPKRLHSVVCETYSEFYVMRVSDIREVLYAHFAESEADKHWKKMEARIQKSPEYLYDSLDRLNSEFSPHVILGTMRDANDLFIPKMARDESVLSMTLRGQHHQTYEEQLLDDEEKEHEHEQEQNNMPKTSILSLQKYMLARESSARRDMTIKKRHLKDRKKKTEKLKIKMDKNDQEPGEHRSMARRDRTEVSELTEDEEMDEHDDFIQYQATPPPVAQTPEALQMFRITPLNSVDVADPRRQTSIPYPSVAGRATSPLRKSTKPSVVNMFVQ